jgi:hypothetical protein
MEVKCVNNCSPWDGLDEVVSGDIVLETTAGQAGLVAKVRTDGLNRRRSAGQLSASAASLALSRQGSCSRPFQ